MASSVPALLALAAAGILLTSRVRAQSVAGSVLDASSGTGVAAAEVVLLGEAGGQVGRALTGRDGRFVVRAPVAGFYRLRASALGYAPATRDSLDVSSKGEITLVVRIGAQPLPLDTLTATATRLVPWLAQEGFYRRQAQGWGYFLDEKAIDSLHPFKTSDLLYGLAGIRVVCSGSLACDFLTPAGRTMFLRGVCHPSVVLDGIVLRVGGVKLQDGLDQLLKVSELAAVEIYPSAAGVPVQYSGSTSPCGALIAWSRR